MRKRNVTCRQFAFVFYNREEIRLFIKSQQLAGFLVLVLAYVCVAFIEKTLESHYGTFMS